MSCSANTNTALLHCTYDVHCSGCPQPKAPVAVPRAVADAAPTLPRRGAAHEVAGEACEEILIGFQRFI